ncbi:MAG: sugar ABC transporter ATP-binding protein [Verrucomicrobiota bacterium]|jgi:ribose transport system ATP-binding protein
MDTPLHQHVPPLDAVRMTGISKTFGGIHALEQVDLSVRHGEIHALLGENGAGKSTLLKILRGVEMPDSGAIEIDGKRLAEHTPEASRLAGIAMIFQEMSLVPTLSVAQNIFLNREVRNRLGLIDDDEAVQRVRVLFNEFGIHIDPAIPVSHLGAGQRQLTEIIKAISQRTRILVLDEPTSALSAVEVEHLFALLQRLKADGVAIIYVSHRMDEIMRIADRATILRDGRCVLTAPLSDLTLEAIIEHIIGRRSGGFFDAIPDEAVLGPPLLELRGVCGAGKLQRINLEVRRGEVVGIAGLLGSGRSSLARLLYGMEKLAGGEIRVNGRAIKISGPQDAIAAGIALIPEDRLRQGLVTQHSVAKNICLPLLDRISSYSWISPGDAADVVNEQMARMRIKAESADTPVNTLSGGNQQKVVLAKWLAMNPEILVLDEPTAGVDVGSKAEIVAAIRDLARQGKAILLISSEIAELLAASDRIAIMADGRIVREILRRDLDPEEAARRDPVERFEHAEHQLQIAIQNVNAGPW